MKGKGYVSLVGAGPGDPGLLTVKALRRIREADLIVYDYLANPAHLLQAKESAVKICVGKRFRYQPFSQEKINKIILGAAAKGWRVVRLKGGDPYLFGRGGEEALYLFKHRVPFEVVPGVTSATACAAYAGIPLTHREHNSSVTFLTGHKAHDAALDSIAWEKIVALNGTIVIYMGFYNLAIIAKRLIHAGMSSSTKVSVIEWGTLPRQRSCDGTLANIAKLVKEKKLQAPAMVIIGDVVSLRKELNWYEKLPLFGKKVVITRASDRAGSLKEKLSDRGASVYEFPAIEIRPADDFGPMDLAIRNGASFDWMVFTSVYGVDSFFERLKKNKKDIRAFSTAQIACVGPETARALESRGVVPDLQPKRHEVSGLLEEFRGLEGLKSAKILLLRTNIAPPLLEEGLKKLGAAVTNIVAYKTVAPASFPADVKKLVTGGEADYITFTSSSTVDHFVKALGLGVVRKIARKTRLASIGPVTSKTLKNYGLRVACQARTFTIDGLVDAIEEDAKKN